MLPLTVTLCVDERLSRYHRAIIVFRALSSLGVRVIRHIHKVQNMNHFLALAE